MVYTIKSYTDFDNKFNGSANKVVLLDFYATWCGPCKMMDPHLKELEDKYGDRLTILKVNVDKFELIADDYKVASLPSFFFFKNGKKTGGLIGADHVKLKQKISKMI